jgi:hypothetical protein
MNDDKALVEQARELLGRHPRSDVVSTHATDLLAGLADEVERLQRDYVDANERANDNFDFALMEQERSIKARARVAALEAGLQRAFEEGRNVAPDANDDVASAIEFWAWSLLDAGQHHRDDGCLDEVVGVSEDAGLYDQQADLCKTCGQLNSDHGIPDQGDDL